MNGQETSSAIKTDAILDPALPTIALPGLNYELQANQLMDLSKLDGDQMARVNQIVSGVSFADTNSLMSFGATSQRKLSQHLDQLLADIRTGEAGRAGEITIALATTIKDLHLSKVKAEVEGKDTVAELFGKLPFIGTWFSALRALQQNHKKITEHLAVIEQKAQADMTALRATNDKLDRMVVASIDHIHDVELDMAAGQILIKRARVDFERKRNEVERSRDIVEIAKLRDFAEQLNAFETRVVRIHLAHSQSMISVPEIRASQTAAVIELNNVMDSILFDLPNLKRAILNVASLSQTAKAAKATEARRQLSRELSSIGSEELQATYLKAKESQGGFEADVAALAQSADKLLQTIELGRKLDAANSVKREKAISNLSAINHKFTDGLLQSGDQFVQKLSQS